MTGEWAGRWVDGNENRRVRDNEHVCGQSIPGSLSKGFYTCSASTYVYVMPSGNGSCKHVVHKRDLTGFYRHQ